MLVAPDNSTGPNSFVSPLTTKCANCGMEERRLLHHVRHRGVFRRLCTTCVLRLNPQSFCPTCFQVYPPMPSNDSILSCYKCYSCSHSHCVVSPYSSPYICPLCAHPNVPVFKLRPADEVNIEIVEGEGCKVMDRDSAKKLLAAAKIAALTMNKAAVAAKTEAERKAREAAIARKKARNALECVANLVRQEKLKKKRVGVENGATRNGMFSNGGGPSYTVEGKKNGMENMGREESSSQVLAALNAVELEENDNLDMGMDLDEGFGDGDSGADNLSELEDGNDQNA